MNPISYRKMFVSGLLLITLLLTNLAAACTSQPPTQSGDLKLDSPLPGADPAKARGFVANLGQADDEIHFMAHGLGGAMLFHKSGIGFSMQAFYQDEGFDARSDEGGRTRGVDFRQIFLDASTKTNLRAAGRSSGRINYLLGTDPQNWFTGLSLLHQVVYDELYPGIDLVYETLDEGVKSTFLVAPGGDPGLIRWQYSPEVAAHLTDDGDYGWRFRPIRGLWLQPL